MKKIISVILIAMLAISLAACSDNKSSVKEETSAQTKATESSAEQLTAFPKFKATDFNDNIMDESIFKDNKVTALNFWFNGCSACVDEMADLEAFNQKLKEKGAEIIGVNVPVNDNPDTVKEAKEILAKQGATYRNLVMGDGKEINDYVDKIVGFPTTVFVDSNGNIIGRTILGPINDEETMDEIMELVDQANK